MTDYRYCNKCEAWTYQSIHTGGYICYGKQTKIEEKEPSPVKIVNLNFPHNPDAPSSFYKKQKFKLIF